MKQEIINLKNKVTEIGSIEFLKSGEFKSYGFEEANELISEDFLKNKLDNKKILRDKIKVLEQELQRSREESFQAGYQEGKSQGIQEAKKQIDEFKVLIKSFEKQYAQAFARMETPLLKLAKKMAEKVVGMDLDNSAELDSILMERLKKLLYEMMDQVRIIIEVNPVHLEWLESPGIENELNAPSNMEITFIGDENLKPGECKINTEDYHIDETYKTKLNRMEQQLLDEDQ